jgi:serine/threonine-protein kinase
MAADAPHVDTAGDVVGRYRLLHLFGEGGMGAVWRAEHADGTLKRQVALKLPRAGWSPGLAERLARESGILASLEHPNIARLYDAGFLEGGRPYLAMESIEGAPIDAYCRARAMRVTDRLRLFLQVAKAVIYAHSRLVVHGDLKPSNLLVDGEGRVHVVDFGLATVLDAGASLPTEVTRTLGSALTLHYASPEQVRGEAIGVASDVYSLGVVLYELLTGRRPYELERETAAAVEEAIVRGEAPMASSRAADRETARALRGDIDVILAKALRKEVAARYATVEAFGDDIERHLRGLPVSARPASLAYRAAKFARRHRYVVAVVVLLGGVTTLGGWGVVRHARIASVERDKALAELRFAQAAEEFVRFLLGEQTGRPATSQELLGRAHRAIAGQFSADPALRARMQLVLSELYGEASDFKRAEVLLREARAAATAAGDASALAQAECAMGSLLGTTGREKEAVELFAANIPKVDARADVDPLAYRICHAWRGNYRRNRAQPGAGADFEAALKAMESAGANRSTTARIRLKASIADAYGADGHMAEALRLYEEASAELARIGRVNTSHGWTLANNHMFNLVRAGHFSQAELVYNRATAGEGGDRSPPSDLAIAFGRVLLELGRLEEAERLLQQAAVEKARIGHRRGEAYALLSLARARCARGLLAACDEAIENARARFAAFESPTHSAFATFKYARGVALMEAGDAAGARPVLEEAARDFASARDRNPLQVRAMSLLALCLDRTGDGVGAREQAAQAVALARRNTAGLQESEWVGSALAAQAAIHARQGDAELARAAATEARRHLEATLGADAPNMRRWDAAMRAITG